MSKNNINPLLSGTETESEKLNSIPTDKEWGVDFLHLSFYVNPEYTDLSTLEWYVNTSGKLSNTESIQDTYNQQFAFGKGNVTISLNATSGVCRLRFNPSTLLYGNTSELIPAEACKPLVGTLIYAMSDFVIPVFDHLDESGTITRDENWAEQVRLSRIDCSRNLLIDDGFRFKSAVEAANPRNKKDKYVYESGSKGWGLVNATKTNGKDMIYDKDVELNLDEFDEKFEQTNKTMFRFETQLKRERLQKFGFRTLQTISDEQVWTAIETRWNACNWDVTFNEPGEIANSVKELCPNDASGLLGYLSKKNLGLEDKVTVGEERKYGAMARKFGLQIGKPVHELGNPTRKVSITLGTVVDLPKLK